MIIDLIIIQAIIVFIIDISGIVDEIKQLFWKLIYPNINYKTFRIKPLDCSLCMTFWVGIIYSWITSSLSIPILGFICLLAFLTPITSELLYSIKDLLLKILQKIN